jgi:hypothetical protein
MLAEVGTMDGTTTSEFARQRLGETTCKTTLLLVEPRTVHYYVLCHGASRIF